MDNRISFSCPTCKARLRASVRFAGRPSPCPRCGQGLVVPRRVPGEQPPMLVFDQEQGLRAGNRLAGSLHEPP